MGSYLAESGENCREMGRLKRKIAGRSELSVCILREAGRARFDGAVKSNVILFTCFPSHFACGTRQFLAFSHAKVSSKVLSIASHESSLYAELIYILKNSTSQPFLTAWERETQTWRPSVR